MALLSDDERKEIMSAVMRSWSERRIVTGAISNSELLVAIVAVDEWSEVNGEKFAVGDAKKAAPIEKEDQTYRKALPEAVLKSHDAAKVLDPATKQPVDMPAEQKAACNLDLRWALLAAVVEKKWPAPPMAPSMVGSPIARWFVVKEM